MGEGGDSNNSRSKDETYSVSFADIVAGVSRMREQYGHPESSSSEDITKNREVIDHKSETPRIEGRHNESRNTKQDVRTSHTDIVRANSMRRVAAQPRVAGPSHVLVHKSQKGNPLLDTTLMKATSWAFDENVLSDYYINPTLQILFLSLKYYKLHPEYIWQRLKKINKGTSIKTDPRDRVLRILLTVVDIDSHQDSLCTLSDICIKHDLSLVLAWSFEEAGNYIAFARQLDNAPAKRRAAVEGVKAEDYNSCAVDTLTSVKSINKTDVSNLLANCKSLKNIVLQANSEGKNSFTEINGLGATKISNMQRVFSEPFIYNKDYEQINNI